MQLTTIEQPNHQVLLQPAQAVTFPLSKEIQQFINDMKQFIATLESSNGSPAGLAAPQVGSGLRIILIQIPESASSRRKDVFDTLPLTVLLNPSYEPIEEEGKVKDWEGCYSVPNKMGEVYRYYAIHYQAYDEMGAKMTGTARGFLARLLQHEIGHINGELYSDLIGPDCRFEDIEDMWPLRQQEMIK